MSEEIERLERTLDRLERKIDRLEQREHDNGIWLAILLGAVVVLVLAAVGL